MHEKGTTKKTKILKEKLKREGVEQEKYLHKKTADD